MALNPLNHHYAIENPASVYDEEAMTALELAGRTTAKVNETVQAFNELESETNTHLENQDKTIEQRMDKQDADITHIRTVTVPTEVRDEVQNQINNGTFDAQIDDSLNHLNERVDNLLATVSEGSTTLDAEVIDIRVGVNGVTYNDAGTAIRTQLQGYSQRINHGVTKIIPTDYASSLDVSLDNGTITATYTKPEGTTPNHAGVGFTLGKTVAQMVGKRIIVIKHAECSGGVALSNNAYSWGTAVWFKSLSDTELYLDVTEDMIETLGTNNVYLNLQIATADSQTLKATPYIIEGFPQETNMANVAYYAHHLTDTNITVSKANHAEQATTAGFSYINVTNPPKEIVRNQGSVTVDKNHVTLTIGEITGDAYYTSMGINLASVKDKLKTIILNGDVASHMVLTRSGSNWSNVIRYLSPGVNDVSDLDLANESVVYLTLGQFGGDVGSRTITYYLLTEDNEVIATQWVDAPVINSDIVCWGDSLTAGGGWTTTLGKLAGRTVRNCGTGGEISACIMARQGADAMLVNHITIPADTTAVQVANYTEPFQTVFGKSVRPLLQGGSDHVNPVYIGDVKGTLRFTGAAYNDTTGTYTFTRSVAGEAVVIDRPTVIRTKADREWNNPHLMVIFIGQNGGYDSIEHLVRQNRLMMEHADAKHTIVLGLSSGTASSRAEYETAMRNEFGRYFISLREYLTVYGLDDAGLTPTEADTAAMAKGEVPPQLLADGVHYTSACKTVIGNMLYKKCCELNIF